MATSLLLTSLLLFPLAIAANSGPLPAFKRIYQFGDSLSDTGNLLRWGKMFYPADRLPYGETYFRKATGRFSDGRLILDHIAAALKLPFIDAYLNTNASFAHGVNFAVAGATANDLDFFTKRNVTMPTFKPPISQQLKWFEAHVNFTCRRARRRSASCSGKFGTNSLFIFGEYGGNDYFPAFQQGKSIDEVKSYVPYTVAAIVRGIKRIVKLGAKRIIVPGPLPFGCMPSQLSAFSGVADPTDYDEFGCLKPYNSFISYHNRYLRALVSSLHREFSGKGVVIVYADYYGGFMDILRNVTQLGFDKGGLLKACCGIGGEYKFDHDRPCGTDGVGSCSEPGRAVHWDGVHLTDAAYHHISQFVIDQVFSKLAF
ncbi:acetylajmalan esterase-like [Ipomoea triloba]|uniref:acetylajmalan esterase-like n=1 Tax=Ipomoea triloba TaxID=35885 RepID=UPI00125DC5DA|nr:acetylajmalan esterase-like [Ipomoea triloba]